MSQAEELLNALAEEEAAVHSHIVRDPDNYFVIDPDTRTMTNVSGVRNVLMQYDHNSEVYTFELPRYVEGHDMLHCNRVRLHYINIGSGSRNRYADVVEMYDLGTNPSDSDTVISTWTIRREATQLAGTLNFLVQYMCVDDAGEVVYEWHTDIYTEVDIKSGMNNGEQAVIEYSNVLEQWYQQLFGLEDSLVATIAETTETQKAAIELKGMEILESIPDDYTTVANMAEEAFRKKADAIETNTEGESIFIGDSSDGYLLGLNLYGRTTQFSTTGAQLIPYPYHNTSNANGEVMWVINPDRSVSVAGTPTVQRWYALALDMTLPIGTYTFSGCPANGEFNKYWMYVQRKSDGYVWREYGNGATFEVTEEGLYDVVANVGYLAGTLTNLTFYPVLNSGSEIKAFEAYSEGIVSPSPDYPQDLTSVENPMVAITGKNLLSYPYKETTKTANGLTFTDNGDGSITIDGTATATTFFQLTDIPQFNGVMSVSGCPAGGSYATYQLTVDKDGASFVNEYGDGKHILCSAGNAYSLAITVRKDTSASGLTFYPCVELGAEITSYEPPKTISTIDIPYILRGLPVESNGNYTDSNGQQWICDEIDFERGLHIQRVGLATVEGDTYTEYILSEKTGRGQLVVAPNPAKNQSVYSTLCNVAIRNNVALEAVDGQYYENPANIVLVGGVDETETSIRTKYQALELVYALTTPIETALTDEEIAYYKQLKTNYPSTTVLNTAGVHMGIAYAADLENYNLEVVYDAVGIVVTADRIQLAVDNWLNAHYTSAEGVSF